MASLDGLVSGLLYEDSISSYHSILYNYSMYSKLTTLLRTTTLYSTLCIPTGYARPPRRDAVHKAREDRIKRKSAKWLGKSQNSGSGGDKSQVGRCTSGVPRHQTGLSTFPLRVNHRRALVGL